MHDGQRPEPLFDLGNELDALASHPEQKKLIGRWLDDPTSAPAFWALVERRGGIAVGDWKFIAEPSEVVRILEDEAHFKVSEYDQRMRAVSGRFYLGMDEPEHGRDAAMGEIIPSWNPPGQNRSATDPNALEQVKISAAAAAQRVLAAIGKRTRLARLTNPAAACECLFGELLGPVLDASSSQFFGLPGPSAFSLIQWQGAIAGYFFRVQADLPTPSEPQPAGDRHRAQQASAQFRAQVMDLIAELNRPAPSGSGYAASLLEAQRAALQRCVNILRRCLQQSGAAAVSDDDVARNLIGIVGGSLTATAKAFAEGLIIYAYAHSDPGKHIVWSSAGAETSASGSQAGPIVPLYDRIIARSLATARRGALDSIYRKYVGSGRDSHTIKLADQDTVIVWLGGSMKEPLERLNPDRMFGVGVHRCPGMDMGKAIMQGVLQTLTRLEGPDSPKLARISGEWGLAFDNPSALCDLTPR